MSARNWLVATTCVVVSAVAITFTDTGHALAAMIQHVIVDSGTVSVSNFPSTQDVSGTVSATQSGTWDVGLSGSPAVTSGDTTVLIQAQSCAAQGSSLSCPPVDVSPYKTVRVYASFLGGQVSPPPFQIVARVPPFNGGFEDYVLAESTTGFLQGVFDTPGTTLIVRASGSVSSIASMEVAIYGRRN